MTSLNGKVTGGMIVETESYAGATDRASHAYGNRLTPRTKPLFEKGGISYVYLCYGMHNLFNVVTNQTGIPHAILIRAIEPVEGVNEMITRRKKALSPLLTAGPGALCQALGIDRSHNALSLQGPSIWIEDRNIKIPSKNILASSRVGVSYAKEDALLPWRFRIRNNPWTSPAK